MALLRYIKRMQFIDFLIRRKATGNLENFASKNRQSKSSLMEVLKEMKEIGFPIKYNKSIGSYFYELEGKMVSSFFQEVGTMMTRDEMKNVSSQADNICFSETKIFEICT